MCQLLINFTYVTISLKMSNYNFVYIYVNFWNDLFSFYVLNRFFQFLSQNFLAGFVFLTPLAYSPCYAAHTSFSITKKTIIRLISNKMCWLIKQLRLNDSFIYTSEYVYRFPRNPDLFFPSDEKRPQTFPSMEHWYQNSKNNNYIQ